MSSKQGYLKNQGLDEDLGHRLSYQQALTKIGDLEKENMLLKINSNRLGEELRRLHISFDLKPRDQNIELYEAIGSFPMLHQYQNTILPLFDAYDIKIEQFEEDFENIHDQYCNLQKCFDEVCRQNEELRQKLNQKINELVSRYEDQGKAKNSKSSDFDQIILQQINQRQRLLVDENAFLDRQYQKYKGESEKLRNQLDQIKKASDHKVKFVKELQTKIKTLEDQNRTIKQQLLDLQIKKNQFQVEKKRLEAANERAQSQNNQLIKERDMFKKRLDELRDRVEKDSNVTVSSDHGREIEQLKYQIRILEAEKTSNDQSYKSMKQLQGKLDNFTKDKQKLKQAIDASKIREQELNETIVSLKSEISTLKSEKSALQKNENKVNKTLQNLTEKSKNDILKIKKEGQQKLQSMQTELKNKIQMKDRRISELQQVLEKLKLEKERVEKQNELYNNSKPKPVKQNERALTKMKQKLKITEQLFKEQLEIFQSDLSNLRRELDTTKNELKEKNDQWKKIRAQYTELEKQYRQVCNQKSNLVEEYTKIRDELAQEMKEKQKRFQQKLKEIKGLVQQSENKRKIERERVHEASKQFHRVLNEIKNTYEGRIRQLQNQVRVQITRTEVVTSGKY